MTFSCISLCHTFSYTQDGATPLYTACQNGHKQTVDVLLKNGANVNLTMTVSLGVHGQRGLLYYVWSVCVCISFSLLPHNMQHEGPKSETIKFSATDGYLPLNTYLRR